MVHKRDKVTAMSDAIVAEMQTIVRRAAEPWRPGDSVKAAIDRAARRLGIGFRRARTFWYGVPCAVRAAEADLLRAADLQGLRVRREALAAEMAEIEARLVARERAADGLAASTLPAGRAGLPVAGEGLDPAGSLVRKARLEPDLFSFDENAEACRRPGARADRA